MANRKDHFVVWLKMSVDDPEGESVILNKGDKVPDFVSDSLLGVYRSTGAIRAVQDFVPDFMEVPGAEALAPEMPAPPAPKAPAAKTAASGSTTTKG